MPERGFGVDLLQGSEGVDGERVGLDGAAVEQDPADAEARGPHLGGEDELRHGRRHVHLVPRRDQVPHHLRSAEARKCGRASRT